MMHNKLQLHRLRIITNSGKIAYDEEFQSGINIIRGDNSSGKSTIAHFIFFVLGGSMTGWVEEALRCDHVIAEVSLTGMRLSIKRYVSTSAKQPMYITFQSLDSIVNGKENVEWKKYSYDSSSDKNSFSNFIFDLLNIPTVYGESNITMHQLLRLMYVDQDSPTNSLFLYEQFDSSLTRQTVAELLLGVYQTELYELRISRRENQKDLDVLESEVRGIKSLVSNPYNLEVDLVKTQLENLNSDINEISVLIQDYRNNAKRVVYRKNQKLEFQKLSDSLVLVRRDLEKLTTDIAELEYEIADTRFFIEMLSNKKRAIENSIKFKSAMELRAIEFCPECLTEISNDDPNVCSLCKSAVDDKSNILRLGKMLQEISFQILESNKVIKRQNEEILKLRAEQTKVSELVRAKQIELNNSLKDVKTTRDEKIDELLVKRGKIEGQILQFATLLEQAEKYAEKIKKIENLKIQVASQAASIDHLERLQETLLQKTSEKIEKFALGLLHSDLNREEGFKSASNLKIDYSSNSIYINDKKRRFSASSNFYLKTVVRFAIFFASLEIDQMRFPRFIICDNMEDNGIEPIRAENFQNLIIETASHYNPEDFQLIYTTSYLPKELKNSSYLIGDYYSEENNNKSLKHV